MTRVFFRDDDVGEMTDPLRFVMDTLLEAAIPCHYQVVPDYLDADAAEALKARQRAHPELVFLNQHGYRHAQMIDGERRATEFAGGRSYEDQAEDIRLGRDELTEALGDSFSGDVFTPPCHKFDEQTVRALGDLGFKTLSAGVRADPTSRCYYALGRLLRRISLLGKRVSYHLRTTPDARLNEVSVSIDVHMQEDEQGQWIEKSVEMLWDEFEGVRNRLPVVGIMLHHQVCDTAARRSALRGFADRLRADPDVQFVTIPEVVRDFVSR